MPEAVDVGSVLGGRYKVTAYVLASAEKDLVLDGVDQVLNRPVSILVASAGNAAQVATSARELATGDRNEDIQVLDLGITESGTYLVTNRAAAADMLDLIVQQDAPAQDQTYTEPFFTDTLGSEIFGGPRSTEPETYDDDEDHYEEYDRRHQRKSRLSGLRERFGRHGDEEPQQDHTPDVPPVAAEPVAERRPSAHSVPPPPRQRPSAAPPAASFDEPHQQDEDADRRRSAASGAVGAGAAGVAAGAAAASASQPPARAASRFPRSGDGEHGNASDGADGTGDVDDDRFDDDKDDNGSGGRTFTRVLVGVVLTVVLVVAVVIAATQLGSLFGGSPIAASDPEKSTTVPVTEGPTTTPPTPSAEPTPEAVSPVVSGITRVVPDNQGLDAANDLNLPLIIDDNPATFWGNQVYASETFGGLATSLALVVQLEQDATITQVAIDQLNGSGGSFSVLVNDQPTLSGAQQIAQGGFTAPTVTLPIPGDADGPRTGRYVIVNFTQLPRLSNIQAQYPFGLRIAGIRVS